MDRRGVVALHLFVLSNCRSVIAVHLFILGGYRSVIELGEILIINPPIVKLYVGLYVVLFKRAHLHLELHNPASIR